MRPENERALRDLVLKRTGSAATETLSLDDDLVERLHIDSLTALEVLAAVEKEFGIRLRDDALHEMRTLRRIEAEIDDYEREFGREGEATCASD